MCGGFSAFAPPESCGTLLQHDLRTIPAKRGFRSGKRVCRFVPEVSKSAKVGCALRAAVIHLRLWGASLDAPRRRLNPSGNRISGDAALSVRATRAFAESLRCVGCVLVAGWHASEYCRATHEDDLGQTMAGIVRQRELLAGGLADGGGH